jgi:hypothetical protein
MASGLAIFGIIFIVIGIIMAIVGIVLLIINTSGNWYTWTLLIGGIVLAIIGGIMLASALSQTTSLRCCRAGPHTPENLLEST